MKLSKLSLSVKLATLAAMGIGVTFPSQSAQAIDFGEFAVDQSKFVAVAVPFNYKQYKLGVIISDGQGRSPSPKAFLYNTSVGQHLTEVKG